MRTVTIISDQFEWSTYLRNGEHRDLAVYRPDDEFWHIHICDMFYAKGVQFDIVSGKTGVVKTFKYKGMYKDYALYVNEKIRLRVMKPRGTK